MTAAQSLRSPLLNPRGSLAGLAVLGVAGPGSIRSPWRWQSISANSRTRVRVALSSSHRTVIRAGRRVAVVGGSPGGVRIQLATLLAGATSQRVCRREPVNLRDSTPGRRSAVFRALSVLSCGFRAVAVARGCTRRVRRVQGVRDDASTRRWIRRERRRQVAAKSAPFWEITR